MKELPVIFSQEAPASTDSNTRGGFDSLGGGRLGRMDEVMQSIQSVSTERLATSLRDIKDSLDEIFSSIQEVGNFELNQIELTLEVTAEGGFALIGSAKAGITGGITLSFAPRK